MRTVASQSQFNKFTGANSAGFPKRHIASSSISRISLGGAAPDDIQPNRARLAGHSSVAHWGYPQIREALAHSDLFGALSDTELDRLIKQGRISTYRADAAVFRRGDPAEDLMIVLCGRIKLTSTSWQGKEVLFDFIESGHCFGEFALLEGRTRKLDATAVKPSEVFALKRRHVLACIEDYPVIAVRTIRVLCARLSQSMEMLEDRTLLGVASRSARALLRLAREHGDGTRIELKISQTEIAGLVGATRERVNRQLCAWCRSGILAFDEGHLTILDHGALRAIAEEV